MHKPIYSPEHKGWFIARFDAKGRCQGSVAHADTEEQAIRICEMLNN